VNQQNPAAPSPSGDGPDRTGRVGEHPPETPDDGDVEHLEGEFGELNKLLEPEGGDPTTSDVPGHEPTDADVEMPVVEG
jgi:hypothetical protein